MQTKIEAIYQQHIRPLSKEERRKLLAKLAEEFDTGKEKVKLLKKRSLLDLEGLGAEIWSGIDAQEYVEKLRDEWEHRPL